MPPANDVFDEENESSDDYLKYCFLAMENEFLEEETNVIKESILNTDYAHQPWWGSYYQCELVSFIRRANDTEEKVQETLRRIQCILNDRKKEEEEEKGK